MNCIEFFTCAKDPLSPDSNEDSAILMPGRLLAVLDGATDISGNRYDDILGRQATGGRLASQAAAHALTGMAKAPFEKLPEVATVIACANAGLRATYDRLGITQTDVKSGKHRFRTTLAAAFFAGDRVRLICLGDCAIRINGTEILRREFPADRIFSAARAAGWSILSERGEPAEAIRPIVREMIVRGLDPDNPPPPPLTREDGAAILASVLSDPESARVFANDTSRMADVLAVGLSGVRRNPAAFGAEVIDGLADATPFAISKDLAFDSLETIEIISDGYPATAETAHISAWEAALAHADKVDPDRIGPYASTKGCSPGRFGDDRTILIARRRPLPAS